MNFMFICKEKKKKIAFEWDFKAKTNCMNWMIQCYKHRMQNSFIYGFQYLKEITKLII